MMSHHFVYWTTTTWPPAIGYNNPTSGRIVCFIIWKNKSNWQRSFTCQRAVSQVPNYLLGLWGNVYMFPPRWRVVVLCSTCIVYREISLFPTTLFIEEEEGGKPPCLTTGFLLLRVYASTFKKTVRGNRNPFLTYRERVNESFCIYTSYISARKTFFFLVPTGRDEAGLTIPIVAIIITWGGLLLLFLDSKTTAYV